MENTTNLSRDRCPAIRSAQVLVEVRGSDVSRIHAGQALFLAAACASLLLFSVHRSFIVEGAHADVVGLLWASMLALGVSLLSARGESR